MKIWEKIRRGIAAVLAAFLLIAAMPQPVFAGSVVTFSEGAKLIGSDGKTYQFSKSEAGTISIYYYNTRSKQIEVFGGQVDNTEPKRSYVVTGTEGSYRGYCVEHGVRTDGTKKMTSYTQEEIERLLYSGLSSIEEKNLQLALFYGYQSGDGISKLIGSVGKGGLGFGDSKYYGKHGSSYNWADWYMATQCLIWEIQQHNRTESMTRCRNKLGVSPDHYLSILSGRPAVDIYNWMVAAIRQHWKFPRAIDGKSEKAPKVISLSEANRTEDGYLYTFSDTTGQGGDYVALSMDGKELKGNPIAISYDKEKNQYRMKIKGEPGDTTYMIKHGADGRTPKEDLIFWGWESNGSHVQTIATGAADPVARYIQFQISEEPPEEGKKPVPEYFPTFEFPVEKVDCNPGWDGDIHTGMGDASLAATYVLYRDGVEVDRVILDEYGTQAVLHDTPWTEPVNLEEWNSGSYTHTLLTEPPTIHCKVEPTICEWTGSVSYEVKEIRPEGRFIEPDTGIRTYRASYYGVTHNGQICTEHPENWSEITYTINYESISETESIEKELKGPIEQLEEIISYDKEVFINDCDRGRIFISKSNESENIFEEEGSSGPQQPSMASRWKVRLRSGGWEGNPYIRFVDEGLNDEGSHVYRVSRDSSGMDNRVSDLVVGTNGCIYLYDIPYGTYVVEEVAADDQSFVLESFEQTIGENQEEHQGAVMGGQTSHYAPNNSKDYDNRYDWNVRNKKKENVIKVVKTDGETGKPVSAENLRGARFYLRYMGSPLNSETENKKLKNYGRLLPNASDINSTRDDYTFVCNENGEVVIPYDLEFGIYRLEEWLLPEGYFIGEKGDEARAPDDKMNYYTFLVSKQENHSHGQEYIKYYQAVPMENQSVKGKISIKKEGEFLWNFTDADKEGFQIKAPEYVYGKLAGAVFGIYAGEDILLPDGNNGPTLYDKGTDEKIVIPTERSTHSGDHSGNAIYDEGHLYHESGAKLYFRRDREVSEKNRYFRKYTTPEQSPAVYRDTYTVTEGDFLFTYDVQIQMEYKASGENVTKIDMEKKRSIIDSPTSGENPVVTWPVVQMGEERMEPPVNYEDEDGNVLDVWYSAEKCQEEDDLPFLQTYHITYTDQGHCDKPFWFSWDGLELSATVKQVNGCGNPVTKITNPNAQTPQIHMGNGYHKEMDGEAVIFTAKEPDAPVYFLSRDGVRTEMYCFGGLTKTTLTIPMSAVEANFEQIVPSIFYEGKAIDWYSLLSPDHPVFQKEFQDYVNVTAERKEDKSGKEVYFVVTLISNQGDDEENDEMTAEQRPFSIEYGDGYRAKIYCNLSETGKEVGIMELVGVDKTSRYAKSDLVEVITTGENGMAISKPLPLGKYFVRELVAPAGFLADTEKTYEVNLQYADQQTPLVWKGITAKNQAISVEIDLRKVFETGFGTNEYAKSDGAVFGLYNANPISYGKQQTLGADQLLDVFAVDKDGKAVKTVKIPPGLYYLKELTTKSGYHLCDTLFYFVAGDYVNNRPLMISDDEEGKDRDGFTAKAVMDGYGKAAVTIDVRNQYPAASMTINGTIYQMNQLTEEESVTVKPYGDRTRCKIAVTQGQPLTMILPDGKLLNLTVMGNTYTWNYDGKEGVYEPEVVETGYQAVYTMKNIEDERKVEVYGAEKTTGIEAETIFKKTDIMTESILSNIYAKVRIKKGNFHGGAVGKAPIDLAEFDGQILLKKGETLTLRIGGENRGVTEENLYVINLTKEGDLQLRVSGRVHGKLTEENLPFVMIDGTVEKESITVYKSVTMARQDSGAGMIQVKINTLNDVDAGEIQNDAWKGPEKPYVPETPQPPEILPPKTMPPLITLEPPRVPLAPGIPYVPDVPQTGDRSQLLLWLLIGATAMAGFLTATITLQYNEKGRSIEKKRKGVGI
ncbi:MAG: Cys-Gln thioester bond-forming surface protein [Firmicutes bacterium]|nr:Cys-Gln thioester bond-forming surface protein [Bacillota bacterium]